VFFFWSLQNLGAIWSAGEATSNIGEETVRELDFEAHNLKEVEISVFFS
jgi:hypothetical protein